MAPSTLTSLQRDVLLALFDAGLGERGYYLTGGTALARVYRARDSEDRQSLRNEGFRGDGNL